MNENKWTNLWKLNHHTSLLASATARRDRNMYFERVQTHNAIVTCALFAPNPQLIVNELVANKNNNDQLKSNHTRQSSTLNNHDQQHQLVKSKSQQLQHTCSAAGCDGIIKIFINKLN